MQFMNPSCYKLINNPVLRNNIYLFLFTLLQQSKSFQRKYIILIQRMQNEQLQQQSAKIQKTTIYDIFADFVLLCYSLLSFFKMPVGDPELLVTSTIGIIDQFAYGLLESILLLILCIYQIYKKHQTWKVCVNCVLTLMVIAWFIAFLMKGVSYSYTLLARPIFISVFTTFGRRVMLKYLKIVYRASLLLIIMWFMIAVWASLSFYLYSEIHTEDPNSFKTPIDSIFAIFEMQTTANFPDIALNYLSNSKGNFIYFILIIVVNTLLINNLVIANNVTNYKKLSEQWEGESFLENIYKNINSETLKAEEDNYLSNLDQSTLNKINFLKSNRFQLCIWTFTIILFFMICYQQKSMLQKQLSICLVMLNVLILSIDIYEFYCYKFIFWRNYYFSVYQLTSCLITIIMYGINHDNNFFRFSLLIILRVPKLIIFMISYLGLLTESFIQLVRKFEEVGFMLFIISLTFSAIGEILFGGINTMSNIDLLIKAGLPKTYVFLNFNNTLTAFNVMFSLLIVNNNNEIISIYTTLVGESWPMIYFFFYYMMGTQAAYNLVLACVLEHVSYRDPRIKNMQSNILEESKVQLKNIETVYDSGQNARVWEEVAEHLTSSMSIHKQIRLPPQQQLIIGRLPFSIIEPAIRKYGDCFSFVTSKRQQEIVFISATKRKENSSECNLIANLNKIMNTIKDENILWTEHSVKSILEYYGINIQNVIGSLHEHLQEEIKKRKLDNQSGNNLQILMQLFVNNCTQNICRLKYDIDSRMTPVKYEMYIKNTLFAIAFNHKFQDNIYLIQTVRMNLLVDNFSYLYTQSARQKQSALEEPNFQINYTQQKMHKQSC